MTIFINQKKFSHHSKNGTEFWCDRCDFTDVIYYRKPNDISECDFMVDISEMISVHALSVWDKLNGFSGYDCIKFKEVKG